MSSRIIVVFVAGLLFNGCAFGVSKLKVDYPDNLALVSEKPQDNSHPEKITLEVEPGVKVSAEWMGNAYPVATARSIIGLTNRYVLPYTRLTSLFKMEIDNNSAKAIDFKTKNLKLSAPEAKYDANPLTIDFFMNRWPTFAVKSQEMLIDQSTAIGEIIRTILRDRVIEPNSSYQGILAFNRVPSTVQMADLSGTLTIDNKESNISFKFKKK
jgi:hypothetical protein